jgi:quercetin dioxygenase-like cupin family protein
MSAQIHSLHVHAVENSERSVVALAPGAGEHVWFLNHLVTVKLRGEGAPYGVLEVALPAGGETPFHRHTGEDEAFYVLEGEVSVFLDGGRRLRAVPGAYVHVPCGAAHGLRAESNLRMLVLSDPRGFVDFTREYGVPAPRVELPPAAPPDFPRLEALSRKYGIELLGPLPA